MMISNDLPSIGIELFVLFLQAVKRVSLMGISGIELVYQNPLGE